MEANDVNELTLDQLLGSLTTHEITLEGMMFEEEEASKKKKENKGIALKSMVSKDKEEMSSEDDDIALFARKFNKFLRFKKKGGRKFQRFNKGDSSKNEIICYKCKNPGHMMAECPMKEEEAKQEKWSKGKKAMMAAWGSDEGTSSEEEQEKANLCLMAREEDSLYNDDRLDEVCLKSKLQPRDAVPQYWTLKKHDWR